MGIKSLPLCALCGLSDDSVEHTLITCPISKELKPVSHRRVKLGLFAKT